MLRTNHLFILLVMAATTMTLHGQEKILTDFGAASVADSWITVNDNVMGGRSKGGPTFTGSWLIFSGATNTNGGGFSSIRTRPNDWKLGSFDGLEMKVRGSKRTFQFDLGMDGRISRQRISFRAEFVPNQEWSLVRIPFAAFKPTFFGREIQGPQAPALLRDRIATLGFFIYDKLDGRFVLEVDWIKTYRKQAEPKAAIELTNAELERYLGFLGGRFGFHAKTPSMVKNLQRQSGKFSGLDFSLAPQSMIVALGLDQLLRLEYFKIFSPERLKEQLDRFAAELQNDKSPVDLQKLFSDDLDEKPKPAALLAAIWTEVERVSPGTTREVVRGIQTGSRIDFKQIRSFIWERAAIDIAGKFSHDDAEKYLAQSFPSKTIQDN